MRFLVVNGEGSSDPGGRGTGKASVTVLTPVRDSQHWIHTARSPWSGSEFVKRESREFNEEREKAVTLPHQEQSLIKRERFRL